MKRLIFLVTFLTGCSRGPHIMQYNLDQPRLIKYACYYSEGYFSSDRRVALCDTAQECNDICAKLPKP